MAKTKAKEPRDLKKVWPAPVRCRGRRMTKKEILERLGDGKDAKALKKRVEKAADDVQAQRALYQAGLSYYSGCGVDLRDVQYELLEEHGRGVPIEYECGACGAPHTVKFGAEPE